MSQFKNKAKMTSKWCEKYLKTGEAPLKYKMFQGFFQGEIPIICHNISYVYLNQNFKKPFETSMKTVLNIV